MIAMSGYNLIKSEHQINDARIAIVASCFNHNIVDRLLDACQHVLKKHGLEDKNTTVIRVPGAFEIPATVHQVIQHEHYDAVITLGTVIRGDTPHFDYICSQCSHSLGQLSITGNIPIIFGVLTVDNEQQALSRVGPGNQNKGMEAAHAAIEMIHVFKSIKTLHGSNP